MLQKTWCFRSAVNLEKNMIGSRFFNTYVLSSINISLLLFSQVMKYEEEKLWGNSIVEVQLVCGFFWFCHFGCLFGLVWLVCFLVFVFLLWELNALVVFWVNNTYTNDYLLNLFWTGRARDSFLLLWIWLSLLNHYFL